MIKRGIQKFKKNVKNVNFYRRDFKFSQLFKILLTIDAIESVMQLKSYHIRSVVETSAKRLLLLNGRLKFNSRSGQPKKYEIWYSQLPCFTLSFEKDSVNLHHRYSSLPVSRWQLDSKAKRSLRCLLAKASW